jgi:hypothetical protein
MITAFVNAALWFLIGMTWTMRVRPVEVFVPIEPWAPEFREMAQDAVFRAKVTGAGFSGTARGHLDLDGALVTVWFSCDGGQFYAPEFAI